MNDPVHMGSDLHVAHLHSGMEWGGGENQVFNLVLRLAGRGVHSTLFTPRDGALFEKAASAKLDARPMPDRGRFIRLSGGFGDFIRWFREGGVNIVHAHDSRALDAGITISRRLGIPLVYSRRIASPLRRNPLSRMKYSARNIRAVIAVSRTVRNVMVGGGYPPEQVHVVPSGIDTDSLSKVRPDPDLKSAYGATRLVVGLGKLSRKKNWPFLVNVAAFMAERGEDLQWLIAGEGPERGSLEKLVEKAGVSSRVHLPGMRKDAQRILKTADVLFSPSIAEGAPGAIREAMVIGIPVVSVAAPGSVESLAGNGWLVKDGDIEGAARAIGEILSDPQKTRAVCDRARASAMERFSFEKTVEGTLNVYKLAR